MTPKRAMWGCALLLSLATLSFRSAGQDPPRREIARGAGTEDVRDGAGEREVVRVAAIGDSLTDARSHGGKYLDLLREACPESRFDNYGKGGENVEQMRRRFAKDVLKTGNQTQPASPAYTHVIVFGGVNDILAELRAGRTASRIQQDLEWMYDQARGAGIRVVAITVSPWGGYSRYYDSRRALATRYVNEWILSRAAEGTVDHVVDAHALLSCGDPEKLCNTFQMRWIRDGLHFNEAAHAKLGRALRETVFSRCR